MLVLSSDWPVVQHGLVCVCVCLCVCQLQIYADFKRLCNHGNIAENFRTSMDKLRSVLNVTQSDNMVVKFC